VSHRRYFGPNDADALLEAIGACRRACIAASTVAPIGGPIYRAANRLMEEIDLGAEVLTGNRRHFWLKPHSTPGSCKPVGPQPDSYDAEWERRKAEREQERQLLSRNRDS
jgi:hypothetical protein